MLFGVECFGKYPERLYGLLVYGKYKVYPYISGIVKS